MSGRAPTVPEVSSRSRRASEKVAEQLADQVATCCKASDEVIDLLLSEKPNAEGWERSLTQVVAALDALDSLAKMLRSERDRLVLLLSTGGPDGRPWMSQAALGRLTGRTDAWVNQRVRGYVAAQNASGDGA